MDFLTSVKKPSLFWYPFECRLRALPCAAELLWNSEEFCCFFSLKNGLKPDLKTVLVIGPASSHDIDKVTEYLKKL